MTTRRINRRKAIKLGAGAAALGMSASLMLPRKTLARDAKLVFWLQPNFNKTADDLLESQAREFARSAGLKDGDLQILKVPGGEISKKMAAALEVGAPPDVTRVNEPNMARWVQGGHLVDMTPIVDRMRKHKGGINESIMTLATSGGKAYGAPMGLNPQAAHVRMDKFEAAGYSSFPETWDEFIEAAIKITKPPFYAYGMALGLTPSDSLTEVMSVVWANGGSLVDDKGRPAFESEGAVAAFKLINDMYNKHKIIPRGCVSWNNSGNNKAYQSGQIAYCVNPTSIYSSLIKNKSKFLDVTALTTPPGGPAGRHRSLYTDYYGVFKASPNVELAKGLVEHFLAPENYSRFVVEAGGRYFPVYPDMVDDPFWNSKPAFAGLKETVRDGHTLYWPGTLTPALGEVVTQVMVQKELQSVLVEGKDAAAAVADVQKVMVQTYKRMGEPV
jgi:multiple sugar transport system substrate-binding protein